MSLKELNSTEIEQVSGGTFLLKAFIISRLFNPQGSGCTSCNPNNSTPIEQNQPTPPVNNIVSPCSSFGGLSSWFKNFRF